MYSRMGIQGLPDSMRMELGISFSSRSNGEDCISIVGSVRLDDGLENTFSQFSSEIVKVG